MAKLYLPPTQNSVTYTLDSQIAAGASSLTLNQSVTGIIQAPGVLWIDRIDSSGNKTPGKREYFTFTGVSGANITGLVGAQAGSTAQIHQVGAIVEFGAEIIQQQALYDVITTEHSVNGVHVSLASLAVVLSQTLGIASLASLRQANIGTLNVASLASIPGLIYPSGASGSVLTSNGSAQPVFAAGGGSGTGGFNALFQVPGSLASYANVGGLIPVPVAFTAGFMNAFVQTPASLASISATILKNNAVIGVVAIAGGATFASSASLSSTALAAGDELRMNINSTASLGQDLSVMLRAT